MIENNIFDSLVRKISGTIKVACPGIIISYDHKIQKAAVKTEIPYFFGDDVESQNVTIYDVPILMLRSASASITYPVNKGDTCLLLFLDTYLKNWLNGKSKTNNFDTKHHLSNCIAIVGLSQFTRKSLSENNEDLLIVNGTSKVRIKKNSVDIESAETVNINTNNITINVKQANINTEQANIKANQIIASCETASITASDSINSTAPKFTQNGDFLIKGNFEVDGTGKISNKLSTLAGIDNTGNIESSGDISSNSDVKAGAISLNSHRHDYSKVLLVTAPEGPCDIQDASTPTGAPQ